MSYDDGLERVPCARCERLFVAMYDWQRYCRTCEHERNGHVDLALAEKAWERGYVLGLARARQRLTDQELEVALGGLPVNDLLALCHPDRHPPERFELANRMSVWLLAMRDSGGDT